MGSDAQQGRAQLGVGGHWQTSRPKAARQRSHLLQQGHAQPRSERRFTGLENPRGFAPRRLESSADQHRRHGQRQARPHLDVLESPRPIGHPGVACRPPQTRSPHGPAKHGQRERLLRATGLGRIGPKHHGASQASPTHCARKVGGHAKRRIATRLACPELGPACRGQSGVELQHQLAHPRRHERARTVGRSRLSVQQASVGSLHQHQRPYQVGH